MSDENQPYSVPVPQFNNPFLAAAQAISNAVDTVKGWIGLGENSTPSAPSYPLGTELPSGRNKNDDVAWTNPGPTRTERNKLDGLTPKTEFRAAAQPPAGPLVSSGPAPTVPKR